MAKQMELSSFSSDSSAFFTTGQRWNPPRNTTEYKTPNYGNLEIKKSDQYCKYCRKSGHVKENCYKLIGYPSHFKFNKPRKGNFGNQQVNAAATEQEITNGVAANSVSTLVSSEGFTKEQCDQLIQMFQSMQRGPLTNKS